LLVISLSRITIWVCMSKKTHFFKKVKTTIFKYQNYMFRVSKKLFCLNLSRRHV
jgi:hypothetical protein